MEQPQETQQFKIRIGIVGGGIGGLAAAVALGRLGHAVTVYEAASELSQVC
jgi:salicylate hydroxylase